jgi:hypothetical protein
MSYPLDQRRAYYIAEYKLPAGWQNGHLLTQSFMDQLERCKDDPTRRLLLGVSVLYETDTNAWSAEDGFCGKRATWLTWSAVGGRAPTSLTM